MTEAFRGSTATWSKACRKVLEDPEWARSELVSLLEEHLEMVFATELAPVTVAITSGVRRAEDLLDVLPTVVAIEQLSNGYTVDTDLQLTEVVLAPSAFIHPFVAARVDERTGSGIVVFGVRSDSFARFDDAPIDPAILKAAKALGDPGRLRLLRLLARESLTSAELQSQIGLSPATVHHHLHQLRAAGFVRQERTQKGMRYTIRRASAADLLERLEELVLGPP
jgi:DNA-binding transcriptional ArsR family regulator